MPAIAATPIDYNGFRFYTAVISGKQLLDNCFARRRNEASKRGFQRSLSVARCRDIANYLDSKELSIPTNIIVSAQPRAEAAFSRGKLAWTEGERSFLVLDGQHRLYSMEFTKDDYELVVAIYVDLTPQQEVRLFTDINTTQRGVPTALLLDIKKLAGTETSIEEVLRQLFDFIASERGSPLKGLMSPSETKRGQISRGTFNSAVKKPLEGGLLAAAGSIKKQQTLLLNYLKAADSVITRSGATRNTLINSTVFHAFMEIFNDVAQMTLDRAGTLKSTDFDETLAPLVEIDLDSYVGSNRPSRAKLATEMLEYLAPAPTITDDML